MGCFGVMLINRCLACISGKSRGCAHRVNDFCNFLVCVCGGGQECLGVYVHVCLSMCEHLCRALSSSIAVHLTFGDKVSY